ncbi:hypothetical protein EVAR_28428_1 [Eumeta japonica]|uniref:Uncharacterized protein n=1 Tax=Eumeta variegata TaxID=151549 RepID=A0A4C1V810_EUMVA|nr:hypothetical protein EVAR_28428_1 [Eumeta japonica]
MPVVAAGIVWLYKPKIRGWFLVRKSRTHPVRPGARTAHNGFLPLFALRTRQKYKIIKKRSKGSVRVQRPTEKPEEEGKQPTAESEACLVQRRRRYI